MFEWDRNNLRKIRVHRIEREEVERVLLNDPIPIYEQDVEGEYRFVYYGETDAGRLLAVILTERGGNIRVVTAYDLDAGQRRDYIERRTQGQPGNEQENTSAKVQERERRGGLVGQSCGALLCEAEIR